MVSVTTTYLEMLDSGSLKASARELPAQCQIALMPHISADFSKFLYRSVGSDLNWADRLIWSRQQWQDAISQEGTETYVLYVNHAPAGYVELVSRLKEADVETTEVEIMYFGLFPEATGQGLGGILLSEGIARAWDMDSRWESLPPVSRVWVHTCSLDGPAAIPNYEARGLTVYHTETEDLDPQDGAIGLWPASS
ncbi:GNAT family N-acetyltransferase [Neomicrococcus lactis]|uniref:Ribosomal protein S18 acetylase RimI-like enzyme n=1 Tax=Neomicrococcus lactis TaxID=732241 RepID=A0A7W8YDF3_9MICC|nr:ribosomal protein S18 acetylase RimI-like enzyme [Neomicrococcus lactis]